MILISKYDNINDYEEGYGIIPDKATWTNYIDKEFNNELSMFRIVKIPDNLINIDNKEYISIELDYLNDLFCAEFSNDGFNDKDGRNYFIEKYKVKIK